MADASEAKSKWGVMPHDVDVDEESRRAVQAVVHTDHKSLGALFGSGRLICVLSRFEGPQTGLQSAG
jgi:hypothetical protein